MQPRTTPRSPSLLADGYRSLVWWWDVLRIICAPNGESRRANEPRSQAKLHKSLGNPGNKPQTQGQRGAQRSQRKERKPEREQVSVDHGDVVGTTVPGCRLACANCSPFRQTLPRPTNNLTDSTVRSAQRRAKSSRSASVACSQRRPPPEGSVYVRAWRPAMRTWRSLFFECGGES